MPVIKSAGAILLSCLVQFAQPQSIISQVFEMYGDGGYYFIYETDDLQSRSEWGQVMNQGQQDEYLSVRGSYRYTDPNNKVHVVRYSADNHGYMIVKPIQPPLIRGKVGITTCMLNTLCGQGI